MRIYSILTIVGAANLFAGALLATAFGQTALPVACVMLGGAVFAVIIAGSWAFFKLKRSIVQLVNQAKSTDPTHQPTSVAELNQLGQHVADAIAAARQSSLDEKQELSDIKTLLAKIDRREGAFDRDGNPVPCATQLSNILRGFGGEFDSSLQQAIACEREIRRATEEIVSGSEAQSDAVGQTATFVEKLSAQIIAACDGVDEALQASEQAKSSADHGVEQFQQLAEQMKQIRNHAAARERKLQTLGQHTREIESIVQTIGVLSSRTDLLALNASIESVRAGEHGRGFAIVAEEVRALAEQSAQAVQDITQRIEMIQLETNQSISVATGEHDKMHQVIERVSQTLESLHAISESAGESVSGLGEIADSTQQQLKLAREMVVAIERSAEASKQNRSRAEGALWTAKTLGQVGTQLKEVKALFRATGLSEKSLQTTPITASTNQPTTTFPPENNSITDQSPVLNT